MKLHSYWRSSCAWRARIALGLKGLDYEYVPVHLMRDGGEQNRPEFTAINPMSQVPVLEDGDVVLTQSLAIIEYLDETHPEPPLLPKSALERARARQLAEMVNAGIQPLQNSGVMQHFAAVAPEADPKAWSKHWIERGLHALQGVARASAGKFMVGDAVTVADICLVPQMYNARRFELDLAPLSLLTDIEARCAELPAFRAAHPDVQPDAPEKSS